MIPLVARPAPLCFEEFLASSLQDIASDGWHEVQSLRFPAGTLCWREKSEELAVLRVAYELQLPLQEVLMLCEPEILFGDLHGADGGRGIAELIAPSDARCWESIAQAAPAQRADWARRDVVWGDGQEDHVNHSFDQFRRLRMALRRDCPLPGSHMVANAPVDSETGNELCVYIASNVSVIKAHSDSNRTEVVTVSPVPRSAIWSLNLVAEQGWYGKNAPPFQGAIPGAFLKFLCFWAQSLREAPAFQALLDGPGIYMVLALRRCKKGPPLLPRRGDLACGTPHDDACAGHGCRCALGWEQATMHGLPGYLRELLVRLNLHDVPVFDRLHGRRLARYQAVLRRTDWERAWRIIEGPFRDQRAAYRRLFGGAVAPEISADVPPRFVTGPGTADFSVGQAFLTQRIAVSKTFVEVVDVSRLPRPRFSSVSAGRRA